MAIDVQTKAYEGPLALLLDLIKENKVDIYDIPIAEITEQYLQCLDQMKQLNLTIAGFFESPTTLSKSKFCILRAPICKIST
ncbi:segregation/condensation protein A [Candidatus Omnitrophota bacterium]